VVGFGVETSGRLSSVLFDWRSTFDREKYFGVSLCPLFCCPHSVVFVIFWLSVFLMREF
jgi:hypothetical protein